MAPNANSAKGKKTWATNFLFWITSVATVTIYRSLRADCSLLEISIQEDKMWTSEDNDVDQIIHSALVHLALPMGAWLHPVCAIC